MDFVDATLLRLADADLRGGLFDESSLEQLLRATYDTSQLAIEAPYQPIFERISFFFDDAPVALANGHWSKVGSAEHSEFTLQWGGAASMAAPRVDAMWTGAIVASAQRSTDRVRQVEVAWASLAGIDNEISSTQPLPTDPGQLELARRSRLQARLRAHLDQPNAFDDAALSRWLKAMGAASATELLAEVGRSERGATLRLVFEPAPAAADRTRQSLAFIAALMIRPAGISISALLDDTRQVRARLDRQSIERARPPGPRPRFSTTLIWVLPATVFDDAAWPGASQTGLSTAEARSRRRAWAGRWLANEGIGLLVPPS